MLLIKAICDGDLHPNRLRNLFTIETILKIYEGEKKNDITNVQGR